MFSDIKYFLDSLNITAINLISKFGISANVYAFSFRFYFVHSDV